MPLMSESKRNRATLIIAKMKKKDGESVMEKPQKDGAEVDGSDERSIAAQDMIKAIEQKDPEMLKEAFQSMMEMCSDMESESESEDSNEDSEE